MAEKVKIAIDLMGGENSPKKNLEGIDLFVKRYSNINDYIFYLYGDETKILSELKNFKNIKNNYKIFDTKIIVSDELSAISSIKKGKNSSMWNSIQSQIDLSTDVTLSAGNTGVLLVMSKMILKTLDNVDKPALAGLWPNEKGMNVVLDLGANIECSEKNLVDFSEMGSALFKSLFPNEKAKLALLNIGSEEIKGTELLKSTFTKLKQLDQFGDFEFQGYIEGNQITKGNSNVIITDGFTGNIALKTAEGTANFLTKTLKKSLSENLFSKFSVIFSYFSLKKFKDKLDPRKYNGAIFLGLTGPVVKSHGGTDGLGFSYSVELSYKIAKGNLIKKIKENLSHTKNLNEKV
ncbi:MAG: phosphate acyltransferase PlsX [Pelagibacteraceae bacterium TMED247]|mgnify:CR=1 FL=1|nr:phosphate acyltransferase [Candidatus Pelagibacter sp.]RPG05780.1 MAG: phosphate acyltransferase PlsX [Pelagibacteraceae bacterium TMED247]|tara:strand:- start:12701 stop:13747 length:1047 start_codon:yes stop_codon:yes gene_type:complete